MSIQTIQNKPSFFDFTFLCNTLFPPLIGTLSRICSFFQKKISPEEIVSQKKLSIKKELGSHSHKLQKLYFDTHSSTREISKQLNNIKTKDILDGSNFDKEIACLKKDLIKFLEINSMPITSMEEEKICTCIQMLKKAEELAYISSAIGSTFSKTEKELLRDYLQHVLEKQLTQLSVGKKLLIPFGYANDGLLGKFSGDGHAVVLEVLRKDITDHFEIKLINTGEGHYYHGSEVKNYQPLSYKFFPLTYKKVSLLKKDKLLKKLTQFSSSTLASKKFTMVDIYCFFLKHFGTPSEDVASYSFQGEIKNCTHKSLQAWLHLNLAKGKSYHFFRAFRISRSLEEVKASIDSGKDCIYDHPIFHYPSLIAKLIRQEKWQYSIAKEDIQTLINYGQITKDYREKK